MIKNVNMALSYYHIQFSMRTLNTEMNKIFLVLK